MATINYQPGISHYIRLGNSAYIAGMFEVVGSVNCFNIGRYNGNGQFECADSGVTASTGGLINNQPYSLSYISSVSRIGPKLYVVGDFTVAGTTPARCVASWDGTTWSALGKGILSALRWSYPVYSAVDSSGGLLVAGSFTSIDGQSCNGLARWDGSTWSPVGFTTSTDAAYTINTLCVAPNNDIYVAGTFGLESSNGQNIIKRWDGVQWHKVGETPPNSGTSISVMAVKGNLLYVAGKFDSIGTVAATNVAVFNLTTATWSPLGSGLVIGPISIGPEISSITFIGDTVYFGGEIRYAGGKPSSNIAAWLPAKPSSVEQLSIEAPEMLALTFSPNPASTNATFNFYLEKSSSIRLVLADALGREVMTIAESTFAMGAYRAAADVSLLPAGVYYARLYTTHGTTSQAAVITR